MAYRIIEVVADQWTPRGEAVALHPKRKPLIIWSGIPGERARVRLVREGRNQVYGSVVDPIVPDPHRIEPICEKYLHCGGCPLMHVDATGQEAARRSLVRAELVTVGLHDVQLGAYHESPDGMFNFRHVVKLGFGRNHHGKPKVGAWGRHNREIVPIPHCNVATPALRHAMMSVAHWFMELELEPFDPATGRGLMRAAVLRQSRTTGQILVTLVAARRAPVLQDYAEAIATGATEVSGVWLHLNDEPNNSIYGRDEQGAVGVRPLVGKDVIEERIENITYRIGPGDFFQTNPAMAAVLIRRVIEKAGLVRGVPFVDLYSGVGGFALAAAAHTGWALGVEEIDGAVTRAREAARFNNVPAEFVSGRVEDVLPGLEKRLAASRPVVAINPARRGLEPGVIDLLVALNPRRIAYVSCNPRALARDVAELISRGFVVRELELFNMFPNTSHVELLAVLDAPDDGEDAARAPRRRVVRTKE